MSLQHLAPPHASDLRHKASRFLLPQGSCTSLSGLKRHTTFRRIIDGNVVRQRPRDLIIYCDYRCAHSVVVDANRWGDDVRRSDLETKLRRPAVSAAPTSKPLIQLALMGMGSP